MRARRLIGFAFATVLGCVHVPDAPVTVRAGTAGGSVLPSTFELVCWNVHKERHRRARDDLERYGATAELVLLQEAIRPASLPSQAWTMVHAFRFVRGGSPAGVATGTSVVPTQEWALWSSVREPFARTPKSALASALPLQGGRTLLVVNVHGVNFRPAAALRDQLAGLDPIIAEHSGPVIVAGDFNTWSRRRSATVEAFAARHRLESVFSGRGTPRLDAVFHRGLTVVDADLLRTRSSDHVMLRVRFAVPEANPLAPVAPER